MHRNIFHASDPAIQPYMAENRGFCRFWGGWGFCRIFSYIYPIGPVWGLLLGSYKKQLPFGGLLAVAEAGAPALTIDDMKELATSVLVDEVRCPLMETLLVNCFGCFGCFR